MAVTLTIELTDQEQAKLMEVATALAPTATPAQIKAWAEKTAKLGLRRAVTMEWVNLHHSSMDQEWPPDTNDLVP